MNIQEVAQGILVLNICLSWTSYQANTSLDQLHCNVLSPVQVNDAYDLRPLFAPCPLLGKALHRPELSLHVLQFPKMWPGDHGRGYIGPMPDSPSTSSKQHTITLFTIITQPESDWLITTSLSALLFERSTLQTNSPYSCHLLTCFSLSQTEPCCTGDYKRLTPGEI